MTKLTNSMRAAYVRQVMADVPKIKDYDSEIKKVVEAAYVELLPKKVRAVYEDKDLRGNLTTWYYYPPCNQGSICLMGMRDYEGAKKVLDAAALAICQEAFAARKVRVALQEKIRAVAYSVTTHARLKEALPEFAKYLPEDEAAVCRTLPATANVMEEFRAAGWPAKKVPASPEKLAAVH